MGRHIKNKKDFYENKYSKGDEIRRTSKIYTLQCVPKIGKLNVLDVGCGSGINSKYISDLGHDVTGVDISYQAITKYRKRGFKGEVADIESGLDFEDNSFDMAFCSEVMEHLINPEYLTQELFRVIRKGGKLVISVPNSAFWIYRIGAMFGYTVTELQHKMHLRFFTIRSMVKILRNTGFVISEICGRNIYLIISGVKKRWLFNMLKIIGFKEEIRFRTNSSFLHLSNRSKFMNNIFADTLIINATKPK